MGCIICVKPGHSASLSLRSIDGSGMEVFFAFRFEFWGNNPARLSPADSVQFTFIEYNHTEMENKGRNRLYGFEKTQSPPLPLDYVPLSLLLLL